MVQASLIASEAVAVESQRRMRLSCGEVWTVLRAEALRAAEREAMLAGFLKGAVLRHDGFPAALAGMLAQKLADAALSLDALSALATDAMANDTTIVAAACADLVAIYERDPAAGDLITPFLYFKGYRALQWHRVAHWLWRHGRRDMALYLQSRVSEAFAVDIHPAVPVGNGVFIDHGTGIVVGETATIGNDVSILQGVTLGGTGKEVGDRHPKIRDGVLLAAGAKVLGNIEVGRSAKVGAGSVVLKDVPPCATVAGVPARIVGWCADAVPALSMDQSLTPDVR
jgi:serine O-acetyltransferase